MRYEIYITLDDGGPELWGEANSALEALTSFREAHERFPGKQLFILEISDDGMQKNIISTTD